MKNITIIITSCILFLVSSLKAQEVTPTKTLTPKTDSLPKKVKEFGIGFTSLTAYSLQYRWGNTKRLFRVNGTITGSTAFGKNTTNATNGESTENSTTTGSGTTNTPLGFNTSLSFSILHFKYLAKKFGLMYGPVAGVSYTTSDAQTASSQTTTTTNNNSNIQVTPSNNNNTSDMHSQTLQPYIGFVLGAVYKINKSFFLYAEIAPNIYYAYTSSTNKTVQASLNSNNNVQNITNNTTSSNNTFGVASLSNSAATITIVYRITGK